MEKAWGGGWGRGGPGEVYGRRSGGRGWGPVFWVPVLALVSPGTAGGGRVPRGCRQTAAHVAGGGGRGEAHQHGTPVHCRVSCRQWCGSHPLGDPQEDHVRPAPQTLPLQLGPSPPTVPRPSSWAPPTARYWPLRAALCWPLPQQHGSYKGHRLAIRSSPVLGCPLLHTASPFTSRTLSSRNQGRGPREKTLIPQG